MRRRPLLLVATAVVVATGVGSLAVAGRSSSAAERPAAATPATAAVERRTLVATTPVDGTLGYGGTYLIANTLATNGSVDRASLEQAHKSAQAQVNAATAALDRLRHPRAADVANARAQLLAAQAGLDGLLRGPAATKAQLASARAQVTAARSALSALQHPSAADVRGAEDTVAAARAQLDVASAALVTPRGILTGMADVGAIVRPGDVLYTIDGTFPVVLMTGVTPAWRDLDASVSDGLDVQQLEANLDSLGFGSDDLTVDEHWDDATAAAVQRWQASIGLAETGTIRLGAVVFEPGPMRITAHSANPGQLLQAGTPVLEASSTDPVVSVALDTALQTQVKLGDLVSVILPDGMTVPGKVSDVATVATAPAGSDGSASGGDPTIAVEVALDDPAVAGGLDQAPVSVNITTATADDVLAVPVSALVLTLDGTYAVQVEEAGELRYFPVELGLFAGGWVEVGGTGLVEGQHVVVAR